MSAPAPHARLSRAQQAILLNLPAYLEQVRGHESQARNARVHGIPLKWLRGHGQGRTAGDSAAFSRAVRRLEARGLVLRSNSTTGCPPPGQKYGEVRRSATDPVPKRTDHLILTGAGEEVAKGLT
jgi:hypothetical protein